VRSIYILLGPPGVGKGTQGDLLAEKLEMPKLATGDMFREEADTQSILGREVQKIMQSGNLIPDEIVIQLVKDRMGRPEFTEGCIFDGFPRTIQQAELLETLLEEGQKKVDRVISLSADDGELVKRLGGRRICRKCNKLYNIYFDPPQKEGLCDHCGEILMQRADDNESTITERLVVYKKQTQPLIDFYQQRGLLNEVNGSGSVDQIQDRILSELGERG